VVSGNSCGGKIEADLSLISRKQLKVKGVSNGAQEFDSAINILAQKILNFQGLIDARYPLQEAAAAFKDMEEGKGTVIIDLI